MDAQPLYDSIQEDENEQRHDVVQVSLFTKLKEFIQLITVEPTMFLYMLAFMLTSVVEQAFFINKACLVDLNYTASICNNLDSDEFIKEKKKVQVVVSLFHQWNDIASQIVPILLALFVGAWSDRRGRKLLLLLGLMGKLWYSVWVVINATQSHWSLDMVIWTACLPSGLTGADLSIFAACFSYICDVSSEDSRTLRVTVLDVTYLVSIPVGVALGNYLFYSVVNQSYAIMFSINASLLFLSLLYSLIRLDWTTTQRQENLSPSSICACGGGKTNCLVDFFDKDHLVQSIKTLFKRRPLHGRFFIAVLIFSLALYTFQRDERAMSYLYTSLEFKWNVHDFSNFRTFQSAFYVVGTTICIPLMSRWLRFTDTTMIMIGTAAHAAARVVFALAKVPWLFYLGSAISSLGPVVAPVIRSMASKIAPLNERGKVFAILSVADTAVPLFSGTVYSQVYNATLESNPSAIFWVTVATQMAVFFAAALIKFMSRGHNLEECAGSISQSPRSDP